MGGQYGPMEAVKMNGSGGEYGGINKGNEVLIVTSGKLIRSKSLL
jgi:hypothetical protein